MSADETPAPQTAREALAGLIWSTVFTSTAKAFHIADAIIAAGWTPPDADQAAPSGADFIRRLLGAWDCCGTCAGGVLAQRDREREADQAATIADLPAEVARLQQQRKAALARAAKAEAERDALRATVEAARFVAQHMIDEREDDGIFVATEMLAYLADRTCGACGRTPAAGYASTWTAGGGQVWLCHGDDDDEPTCYMSGGSR